MLKITDSQIIKMAGARYKQSYFQNPDPSLNYDLGYMQGFQDAIKFLQESGMVISKH